MSHWDMYWIMQLDNLILCSRNVVTVFGIFFPVGVIFYILYLNENKKKPSRLSYVISGLCTLVIIFCSFCYAFLPSTKNMCAILTIPTIVNNETFQKDASDVYKLGMEKFKDILEVEAKGEENE